MKKYLTMLCAVLCLASLTGCSFKGAEDTIGAVTDPLRDKIDLSRATSQYAEAVAYANEHPFLNKFKEITGNGVGAAESRLNAVKERISIKQSVQDEQGGLSAWALILIIGAAVIVLLIILSSKKSKKNTTAEPSVNVTNVTPSKHNGFDYESAVRAYCAQQGLSYDDIMITYGGNAQAAYNAMLGG